VEYEAGDSFVARVIELLTRSEDSNGGGKIFVDYSSLDVRHLGSIYEGILEYDIDVADEPLTLEDGEYVPAEEGEEVIVEEGELYLLTDVGERKATGSYYTPEYVVEYIVENTLGPLVEEIRENLVGRSAFDEGGVRRGVRRAGVRSQGARPGDGRWPFPHERGRLPRPGDHRRPGTPGRTRRNRDGRGVPRHQLGAPTGCPEVYLWGRSEPARSGVGEGLAVVADARGLTALGVSRSPLEDRELAGRE
jgi:hypothetical protein